MKTVRVGIVGCGKNSDNHLRVHSSTDGVRLVAVCDTDLAKAREKARKYGAEHALADYHRMLDFDLDLVDIVTPTPTHAELSQLALEAGHNVLVEKPMAVSSKECLAMIDAARKNGRTLCVVHNKRFFDSVMRTKTTIDSESLTVSRMRVTHYFTHAHPGFLASWRLTEGSGGILWDGLVHQVYLTEHFIGPIKSVHAVAKKVQEQVFDSFTLVLQNERRAGICEFIWDTKEALLEFQLVTEEGDRFHADLIHDLVLRRSRSYRNRGVSALRSLSDDLYSPLMKWTGHFRNFLEIRSYPGALPFEKTFFTLIRRLLSFLSGVSSIPPVAAEEGLRAVRVLEAARKSIETGEPQSTQ